MVLGGYDSNAEYSGEIVDFSPDSDPATSNCPEIPRLPIGISGGVGGFVSGRPVICGGGHNSRCFALENGAWEQSDDLGGSVYLGNSVVMARTPGGS